MSTAVISPAPPAIIEVRSAGTQGAAGLVWIDTPWAAETEFALRQAIYHNGTSYRVRVAHVAATENEPGTGEDWEDFWSIIALGTESEAVETVAAHIEDVEAAADNMAAIIAAPDAAEAAAESAAAANVAKMVWRGAWSVVTDYAPRDVVQHSGSSWIARTATTGNAPPTLPTEINDWWELASRRGDAGIIRDQFAMDVGKPGGPVLGSAMVGIYPVERSVGAAGTMTRIFMEVLEGAGSVAGRLLVNGALASSTYTATNGAPVNQTGLAIAIPLYASIDFEITEVSGAPVWAWIKTDGVPA